MFSTELFANKKDMLNRILSDIMHKKPYIEYYYVSQYVNGNPVLRIASIDKSFALQNRNRYGIIEFDEYKDILIQLKNVELKESPKERVRGLDFLLLLFIAKESERRILYTMEIADEIGINGIVYENNEEFEKIIWQMLPEIRKEEEDNYNNMMLKIKRKRENGNKR
jgi:hypothetical protein